MTPSNDMTRRNLIGRVAIGSVAFPTIVPSSVFGRQDKPAPSERITVGVHRLWTHGERLSSQNTPRFW
jgi:hypothetical protein